MGIDTHMLNHRLDLLTRSVRFHVHIIVQHNVSDILFLTSHHGSLISLYEGSTGIR